jgi:ATP-binding cassette subfamily F protein uup
VQEVPPGSAGTIADFVAGGVDISTSAHHADWERERQVTRAISLLSLEPLVRFETLSSGMKRRVLLARTLVSDPEVLLLDEPTNHLDLESITWLEEFLARFAGTLVFVTHDRVFMQRLATRIVELERGRLFDWTCDYATFLERKAAFLEAEAHQQAQFDKKLAQEEVWIRQGIKARRTRNEGRVRALEELRRQHRARRKQMGTVRMQAQQAANSGRLVIEAKGVAFSYGYVVAGSPDPAALPTEGLPRDNRDEGDLRSLASAGSGDPRTTGGNPRTTGGDRSIVSDLSLLLMRGDKVGILGPNGCGKTTLLRLLLGQLSPNSGTVRHGTNLEIAYFDQLRDQIDEECSVQDNVSGGADSVLIDGQKRHIIGYLQDFLFSPERSRSPARFLSGGERNRLMLAKLFTKPSNVLVLDEPTNDLDTETLELLESLLVEYGGTVLLVSHDRAFLNNVATSVLAFEGDGVFKEYEGGYDDWSRQQRERATHIVESPIAKAPPSRSEPTRTARSRKLTFKEEKELEALPARIEQLESEQQQLHDAMLEPGFFRQPGALIAEANSRLQALQVELAGVYERWEELEAVHQASRQR